MNTNAHNFASFTTDELLSAIRELALEIWKRSQPLKAAVVRVVKSFVSRFF